MNGLSTPEIDEKMTWKFLKHAWRRCPHCGSPPCMHEIRNFMPMWGDGHHFCNYCNKFIATWDEVPERLIA